jgi:hypothetical protein
VDIRVAMSELKKDAKLAFVKIQELMSLCFNQFTLSDSEYKELNTLMKMDRTQFGKNYRRVRELSDLLGSRKNVLIEDQSKTNTLN